MRISPFHAMLCAFLCAHLAPYSNTAKGTYYNNVRLCSWNHLGTLVYPRFFDVVREYESLAVSIYCLQFSCNRHLGVYGFFTYSNSECGWLAGECDLNYKTLIHMSLKNIKQIQSTGTLGGKPVYTIDAKSVLNDNSKFDEKLLCDGLTFTAGNCCVYGCKYCYVDSMLAIQRQMIDLKNGTGLEHSEMVVRRKNPQDILRGQLFTKKGNPRGICREKKVIYSSPLVDCAATIELVKETAELCKIILENTQWDIRLLSKSALLPGVLDHIPTEYHQRLILGLSLGTLDDKLALSFEVGTSRPSARIRALHRLQDDGIRTFGMICPSLPQSDYEAFSKEMCDAIRVDRCEHVWAEIINVRGASLKSTADALRAKGYHAEAAMLENTSNSQGHEECARETFLAHAGNITGGKLRFLQYVTKDTRQWWEAQKSSGAILLGKHA